LRREAGNAVADGEGILALVLSLADLATGLVLVGETEGGFDNLSGHLLVKHL
jgi:hypothetical protein